MRPVAGIPTAYGFDPFQIATLASKDNAIRKVFDKKPMTKPLAGVNVKSERCLIEKSEKSASINTKQVFTIIAE